MKRAMIMDMSSTDYDEDPKFELVDYNVFTDTFTTKFDMTSLSALVFPDGPKSSHESMIPYEVEGEENRLSLAYERLHTIPKLLLDRYGPTIQILDISHNRIKNLNFLKKFKRLTTLIADNNLIDENSMFPRMPKLELLWLNHCKVENLYPWMRKLRQSCPNLKHICLMGNPAAPSYLNGGTFYEYLQYRLFVISLFPSLVHLDDRTVTKDQRAEAQRLYRRPWFERVITFADSKVIVSSTAMYQWRILHDKMAAMFEPPPTPQIRRNFFV